MSLAVQHAPPARPIAREIRATAGMALPLVLGQLAMMGQNIVDSMLAGHRSEHVLGVVGVATSIWVLAQLTAIGLMMPLSPFVSQYDGAGERHRVGALFTQALWLALATGLLLVAALRWGAPLLVDAIGVAPALRPDVAVFLRIVSFGAPGVALFAACRGLSEGLSMPRPSMALGVAGLALLAPLGWVLIYGHLGLPALDSRGSAIAQATASWMQALLFVAWLRWSGRYRGLGWAAARLWPDRAAIAALLRVGIPISVSQLMESSLFTTAALLIGRFGAAAAGAHLIALNMAALTFMVPLGVAIATTVRVGLAVGQRNRPGVRRAGLIGIGMALAAQGASSMLLLGAPHWLAGLFTHDPDTQARAAVLLRLAGVFQLSDGLQVAAMGALRGMKDTRVPMFITALAYWGVGMPLGMLFAFHFGLQAPGVWLGLIGGLTIAALLLGARFLWLTRRAPLTA